MVNVILLCSVEFKLNSGAKDRTWSYDASAAAYV